MFQKTNLEDKIFRLRSRRISSEDILAEVKQILVENESERIAITEELSGNSSHTENGFDLDLLDSGRIYHIDDIQKICVDYRLRFLDSKYFKGDFPEEAVSKIRQLEKEHDTKLGGFKVVAPAKRLKLENADDPLLLAPIGNGYHYLIHKWGNDLHPMRKWLMWPYKNFENLVFSIFVISILLTAITPLGLLSTTHGMPEYVLLFLFMFKSVGGVVLYVGFAKGKNFNNAIWDSQYYNG